MPISVHQISFRGLAGSIFICVVISLVAYVISFATNSWIVYKSYGLHKGLWEQCTCSDLGKNEEDWFKAVQAMITLGLIGLVVALIIISIYMCVHSVSKNTTITAFVVVAFVSVAFMAIGYILLGTKKGEYLHWSFAVSVIGAFFCLLAGILAVVQMRQSNV